MNISLGRTGDMTIVGSGNRVSPGINHRLIDMPGVNDKKSKSNILPISDKREFKKGEKIQGFDVDNEETVVGKIVGFEHGDDNKIIYYVISDDKNTKRRIDASDVEDWDVNEKDSLRITGGKGENLDPDDVDPDQLSVGIMVELEHTKDPKIAERIAIDHIHEDPLYYTKLINAGLVDEEPAIELAKELGILKLKESVVYKSVSNTILSYSDWIRNA